MVVKSWLELEVELLFYVDLYGYRFGCLVYDVVC